MVAIATAPVRPAAGGGGAGLRAAAGWCAGGHRLAGLCRTAACIGPLAYSGAARGFDAVVFNMPLQATLLLGFGWGFAMWLLVAIARVDPATTLVQREVSA